MERHKVVYLLEGKTVLQSAVTFFCLTSQLASKHICAAQATQNPSQQLLHLFQLTVKTPEAGSLWVIGEQGSKQLRYVREN